MFGRRLEKSTHLPLHHWNGCMKFDSRCKQQYIRALVRPEAGEEPSSWAPGSSGRRPSLFWSLGFSHPRAGSLSLSLGPAAAPPKTTIKISRSARIPQILGRSRFSFGSAARAARRVPKSGLTAPRKDWEIWDWGLDQNRRPHVLLDLQWE